MFSTNAATRRAVVKFEFNSTEDNQLTISKGEEIDLIGEVTAEGWVLARKENGDEGYIPDKYFEITASKRPKRPPPLPSSTASPAVTGAGGVGGGSANNTSGSKPSWATSKSSSVSSSSKLLKQGDEYGLFAYQYEWWTVLTLFTGGILNFLYSTTLPDDTRVVYIITAIVAVLVTCILLCIVSIFRYSCDMCGMGTTGLRIALYLVNAALLAPLPVGVTVVSIGVIAAVIEFETKRSLLQAQGTKTKKHINCFIILFYFVYLSGIL